jgi:diguanylate cyclase (GGDEF)-like protein/PAS domain S-box-containing protein
MTETGEPAAPAARSGRAKPIPAGHLDAVRTVFDASPIGVAIWSLDGGLLHANPVLCDLAGRSAEDLVGEVFATFIDPADEPAILQAVEAMWRGTRNFFECDVRARDRAGGDLWLRAYLHAVYGPKGCPEYLVSQVFSFEGRRHRREPGAGGEMAPAATAAPAPAAPRPAAGDGADDDRSADVVRSARAGAGEVAGAIGPGGHAARLVDDAGTDLLPALVWLADRSGRPVRGNSAFVEFLGTGAEGGLFARVHAEDRAALDDEISARVAAREPYQVTARCCRADGEWRWLMNRGRPLLGGMGELEGYTGVSVDVTAEQTRLEELGEVDALFRAVTERGPLAVARTDLAGRILYLNQRWDGLMDGLGDRLAGTGWFDLLLPEHLDRMNRQARRSLRSGEPFEMRVRSRDTWVEAEGAGGPRRTRWWGNLWVAPVFGADGEPDGFVATLADVTGQIAETERAERLASVLDAGSDFLIVIERNGVVSYLNRAAQEELGLSLGRNGEGPFLMDVLDTDSFMFFHRAVEPVLAERRQWTGELTVHHADGEDVPVSALALAHTDDGGRLESITLVARDISDLKQAQWRMSELATHDYLTGLPNRVLLYERLDQALARFHRLGQTVALLYLDLDRFKPINDELGHHVGDAVLVTLADRMHEVVRDTDTPARIGGDEFAVLIEGYEDPDLLGDVAKRLIDALSEPIETEGVTVRVGVSVGIVAADDATTDADSLLARGDAAMYEAKASGRGCFVFAEPGAKARPRRTTGPKTEGAGDEEEDESRLERFRSDRPGPTARRAAFQVVRGPVGSPPGRSARDREREAFGPPGGDAGPGPIVGGAGPTPPDTA